jgi:DNA-binding NtrC family response regulator
MSNQSVFALSPESCAIVGNSPATLQLLDDCARFAKSQAPILLVGPAGSEFEKIAAYLHYLGGRADQPFIRQRCMNWQDLSDPLRLVGSGTLFVEGVQHASLPVQLRLLSELDEARWYCRQSDGAAPLPPRVIASTTEDLSQLVNAGLFLDDLYWQLCSLTLPVPSLRQRAEDIPAIAQSMLDQLEVVASGSSRLNIPNEALEQLQRYDWPGNYRQLQSVMQRAVVLARDETLQVELPQPGAHAGLQTGAALGQTEIASWCSTNDSSSSDSPSTNGSLSNAVGSTKPGPASKPMDFAELVQAVVEKGIIEADRAHREPHSFVVDRVEKALIVAILAECDAVQTKAAVRLGINRNTLHKKIKDYGLE